MIRRMPYLLRLRMMIHWLMLFPVMSVVCRVSCKRLLANASPCNERLKVCIVCSISCDWGESLAHCYAVGLYTWSNRELEKMRGLHTRSASGCGAGCGGFNTPRT